MARLDERAPLLWNDFCASQTQHDHHDQFCMLVGIPPSSGQTPIDQPKPGTKRLYERAKRQHRHQNATYMFTAALSNTLLLTQVVLGASLTALGASESSHILITIFGAVNTIIAGVVAYLKSRGQPMRARMFRDDLERIVDEIENSEIMWMGITRKVHGYDEIDIDDEVSVRSEVARLTRLYDRAVRNNTLNNPDMYMAGSVVDRATGLRARPLPGSGQPTPEISQPAPVPGAPIPPPAAPNPPVKDPDESPATKMKSTPPPTPAPTAAAVPPAAPAATPPIVKSDPDESPATAAPKKTNAGKEAVLESAKNAARQVDGAAEEAPKLKVRTSMKEGKHDVEPLKDTGYVSDSEASPSSKDDEKHGESDVP